MPETDLELTVRSLKHFMTTGEVLLETLAEDVEVYDHDILDGYDYRGHDGFMKWLADWEQAWSDWKFVPTETFDEDGTVLIVGTMTAKGALSGVQVERQDALLYRMRDGKIARVDYFNNRDEAIAASGLSKN